MAEDARCEARQQADMVRCLRCRLAWDTNDSEPPPCPLLAPEAEPAPELKPLTAHTIDWLRTLSHGPIVRQAVNPGVADRLERGELAATVDLPSPFKTHKGRMIRHLRITPAGLKHLAWLDARPSPINGLKPRAP